MTWKKKATVLAAALTIAGGIVYSLQANAQSTTTTTDFMTSGLTPDAKTKAQACPYSDARKCWLSTDANFTFQALVSIRTRLLAAESSVASHTSQIASLQASVAQLQAIVGGTQGSPTLSSFAPTSGTVGTVVTITGTKFTGASAVKFNGTASQYTVVSDTSITATVPAAATTGTIQVTTPGGNVTSGGSFTVSSAGSAPTITTFSPASATRGDTIAITGTNLSNLTYVSVGGLTATYTALSSTSLLAVVPTGAATGTIVVTNAGGSATSASNLTVVTTDNILASNNVGLPAGSWTATDPTNGGANVGSFSFDGGSKVAYTESGNANHFFSTWNTKWTTAPTLGSTYKFTARIYGGARTSVAIALQTYGVGYPGATVDLTTCTTTEYDAAHPAAIRTATAVAGQTNTCDVVIAAQFLSTTLSYNGASWNVTIQSVPSPATAAGGAAFHVENARLQPGSGLPAITSFSPTSGPVGTSVAITGRNFTGATAVRFNGASASFSVASDTTINATVPTAATTGTISVASPGGTGTSASSYTVQ